MQGDEIFAPFIGMLLLTLIVWIFMYVRRVHFISAHRIDPQRFTTPEKAVEIIPEAIHWPAHNLRNLFELPVVFYALCLYLFLTDSVDAAYVISAWLFLVARIIHSVIHCTVNIVKLRFVSYMLGALVLWFMVLRAALKFFV